MSPLPDTRNLSAPPCWRRMNLPLPVSLTQIEELILLSLSAEEGASVTPPPEVKSVAQENLSLVKVSFSLAVQVTNPPPW